MLPILWRPAVHISSTMLMRNSTKTWHLSFLIFLISCCLLFLWSVAFKLLVYSYPHASLVMHTDTSLIIICTTWLLLLTFLVSSVFLGSESCWCLGFPSWREAGGCCGVRPGGGGGGGGGREEDCGGGELSSSISSWGSGLTWCVQEI